MLVVMGTFVNNVFVLVIRDVTQENWLVGPISIVMFILIYCLISIQLVHRCYDMCHVMVDAVMARIGGSGSQHSNNNIGGQITAAMAGALAGGRGAMPMTAGKVRQAREENDRKAKDSSALQSILKGGGGGDRP